MDKTIIVIPTYNEAGNAEELIRQIFTHTPEVYVMIVDDNSPDGTSATVAELQHLYPHLLLFKREEKQGLGVAYRAGFKKALELHPDTKILGMMDADLSHNPKDLQNLLKGIRNYDVVIGSAHLNKKGIDSYSLPRALLSRWANFYCRTVFEYDIKDWTNAFMVVRTDVLRKISLEDLKAREFAFIFGLKYALLRLGARFLEVHSSVEKRAAGESKMTMKTITEGMTAPWKVRRDLSGETLSAIVANILQRFLKSALFKQMAKFLIFGLVAASVNLLALYIFTEIVGMWYIYSVVFAFLFAFITSFSFQKLGTFKDKSVVRVHVQLSWYLIVTLGNLIANIVALYLLVELFDMWYLYAQIVIEGVIATETFLFYKFLIFKKIKEERSIIKRAFPETNATLV